MHPVTILLVDDHKLIRQGMRSLLETRKGYSVVGEAGDGQGGLEMIERFSPDVAILDVMMPGLNGIEVTRLARQRGFKTKILVLSMFANAAYAVRALQGGALGYVLKEADFSEILCAIDTVMDSRRYLSPEIAEEVLEMLLQTGNEKESDVLNLLSPREREILQLVGEGKTNAVIADKLILSVRTVESHRFNAMKKLRINSHADLVKFAINAGLVTSEPYI
ncbi:MAG TPA: response regulator transcription factor [Anaerolineales bacterium]|nr:response regulator transcription factor [Anaerolineales bacterium]HMV95382.1 response regulator transcription factor [Anaerolineales bacterium]HMX19709.1 response regulator transcription factor [Anaerolineales bacterium]HMX74519.1 response regulator transcription factor [Anaerolineales bacterium]HMZ43239.1 response regulator transcription factor [Anaerolineales bacterium]